MVPLDDLSKLKPLDTDILLKQSILKDWKVKKRKTMKK